MQDIQKRFGAVRALGGVTLEVRAGETHALIGENGAGKSTLMKVLSGAHAADAGTMQLAGKSYAPRGPAEARDLGVAMIYQELTLAPHLTVAQNLVLGREPRSFGLVDERAVARRVHDALAWLDQPALSASRKVATLSPGEKQLVEVARALVGEARVVVMDEPTSSLSRLDVEPLFRIIARLCSSGVAVIYISHFLEEVTRVAQRYTVLRDGQSVATGSVPREPSALPAFHTEVLEAMAGRALSSVYPRVPHTQGPLLLELEALSGKRLPQQASLRLHRGEVLGIAGLVGAGRTELLRALFALDPVRHGRVRIRDLWDDGHSSPRKRLVQGVGLLSEDRKGEGLALKLSIAQNLTLSRPIARRGVVLQSEQQKATDSLAAQLGLCYASAGQPVEQLSGGNQQKVALARLLHHDVDVLLLDEPTRGIDVASKAEIYRAIGNLAARGKAVLFVSSYLPELLGVCDRIAVMCRGRLGEARPAAEWSETSLLEAATLSTVASAP